MYEKINIQKIGYFLSNIITPNITIFMVCGILSVFFSPLGWFPNIYVMDFVNSVIVYVIPVLIAYTAGSLFFGKKGGIVGSIAVLGIIYNTTIPMLSAAMFIGSISGWLTKALNKIIKNSTKQGFEMLSDTIGNSILSIILLGLSAYFIRPFFTHITYILNIFIKKVITLNCLPLIAILIEPAKVFFLNNVINHGIFTPLGIQEVFYFKKSIFFLIESNPGPGAGVLMAYALFGSKNTTIRKLSWSNFAAHCLGGVHEVYFSYILKKPQLFFSLIFGSMSGIYTLIILKGGGLSVISPGSIFTILATTPKGCYVNNLLFIFISFLVSFIFSLVLIRQKKFFDSCLLIKIIRKWLINNKFTDQDNLLNNNVCLKNNVIKKVIIACDAGLGSSALGSNIFHKELNKHRIFNVQVCNSAINLLPNDRTTVIITHKFLTHRAVMQSPDAQHYSINNFLDVSIYRKIIKKLFLNKKEYMLKKIQDESFVAIHSDKKKFTLSEKHIFLNQKIKKKIMAIKFIGLILYKLGYIDKNYILSMIQRENLASTFLGEFIAIPHGTLEGKNFVKKTAVIFLQIPNGICFGDEKNDIAKLIIGIAANNNEHLHIVSRITNALDKPDIIQKLIITQNKQDVIKVFL
ncbi:PTS system mannitol-specific EIICBA component [Buchnera aphidicola (Thelaxes suberi)]|uniref:PTS mannitol transporter subunit IICBA n=1 Tax=Buchnera aphidicola TaxID=9 RepID=UPI003463E947